MKSYRFRRSKVIIAMAALISLSGCGGKAAAASSSADTSASPAFSYAVKSFREFDFQIPDTWFVAKEDGTSVQYQPASVNGKVNVMLEVSYSANVSFQNGNGAEQLNNTYSNGTTNITDTKDIMVAGNHMGQCISGKYKDNSKVLCYKVAAFDATGGVICFTLLTTTESEAVYAPVFDVIIDSLSENGKDMSAAVSPTDAPSAAPAASDETSADGVTPSFRETMDSYEAFFDEYVNFMQKYKDSSDPTGMLQDYMNYLQKYTDLMEKLDAIDEDSLSAADAAYYIQVMARIEQKLLSIQ